jgi:hypothetical protein
MAPRNFPPAPGWSADGAASGCRIKAPLKYDRGLQKVWVRCTLTEVANVVSRMTGAYLAAQFRSVAAR